METVDSESDPAPVQLQTKGVCGVPGRGCHENAIGPLGAKAQRDVLRLGVHRQRQLHLHKLAAVVGQDSGVCKRRTGGEKKRSERMRKKSEINAEEESDDGGGEREAASYKKHAITSQPGFILTPSQNEILPNERRKTSCSSAPSRRHVILTSLTGASQVARPRAVADVAIPALPADAVVLTGVGQALFGRLSRARGLHPHRSLGLGQPPDVFALPVHKQVSDAANSNEIDPAFFADHLLSATKDSGVSKVTGLRVTLTSCQALSLNLPLTGSTKASKAPEPRLMTSDTAPFFSARLT
ncbi:hypothetical protein EYF80_015938 [Liparis tanakae]|uniref:Uncharacterized protein n=1 Tax=Liparis tanakae TaxID=230148 RepID=A0A4Z2I7Z0_9TELE|nr:hypothetical protein EYF80_015938 [Liparis tanakae]